MTSLARVDEDCASTCNDVEMVGHNKPGGSAVESLKDVLVISDPIAPQWSLNDFEVGCRLGEGQFGAVFLARERRTRLIVALKAIKKTQLLSTFNEHLLRREIEIHSHLIHPNILGFYGWFVTNSHIVLILEVAPKGELMDALSDGGLAEPTVARCMMQMICALRCCHRLNVMHRDLKPENILVDIEGNLKLADFGWAAHVPEASEAGQKSPASVSRPPSQIAGAAASIRGNPNFKYLKTRRKTYCGTLDYLSPEICRHEWYGKEVDLWCLGVLCYELATGGPPFSHDNYLSKGKTEEEARKLQQQDIQSSDIQCRLLPSMSSDLKDFLCKTLAKDPAARINTSQMLTHPFITKYNDINAELELEATAPAVVRDSAAAMPPESRDLIYQGQQNGHTVSATPGPSHLNYPASPPWQFSRHFLSAASSPNSGSLGQAALSSGRSPFPSSSAFPSPGGLPGASAKFLQGGGAKLQMFAAGAVSGSAVGSTKVLLQDGKVVVAAAAGSASSSGGFALFRSTQK